MGYGSVCRLKFMLRPSARPTSATSRSERTGLCKTPTVPANSSRPSARAWPVTAMILSSGESLRRISTTLVPGASSSPRSITTRSLVLVEDLHALAGRVGFEHGVLVVFELALKRLARHRLCVDEQDGPGGFCCHGQKM